MRYLALLLVPLLWLAYAEDAIEDWLRARKAAKRIKAAQEAQR